MHYEQFMEKRFTAEIMTDIERASGIIDEYMDAGYTLTLRQLYYQFVARDLIPNTERSYKRLGNLVSNARLAGLLPWDAIEDRTRNVKENPHWSSPAEIIESCANQFRYNLWRGQNHMVEVWIEKEALVGVISKVCRELDVPYFACRGYVSQSELWEAGQRMARRWRKDEQSTLVLHLGDHDPSGIDMTRDNIERLKMFSYGAADVKRIALNWEQVERYRPPPNPAKTSDSRFEDYEARFGKKSWELDALEPRVLDRLIRDEVAEVVDHDLMNEVIKEQSAARLLLTKIADNWETVSELAEEL